MAAREDFSALWERIDAALARYAPLVRGSLRAPLAPTDETAVWVKQSAADAVGIAGAYRAHDGAWHAGGVFTQLPVAGDLLWTRMTYWLTARAARDELARLTALPGSADARRFPIGRLWAYRPSTGYEAEKHSCLAVDTVSGELLALQYFEDTAPAQVSPLGFTWSAYLHNLEQTLAAGELEAYRDDYQVLHLQPRRAVTATVSPCSDAQVLVQLLGERSLLRLHGAPSPQLLLRVRQALRKRTENARLTALRATFAELEEVNEDYASEDELAALVTLVRGS